jgi:hypothetical protein
LHREQRRRPEGNDRLACGDAPDAIRIRNAIGLLPLTFLQPSFTFWLREESHRARPLSALPSPTLRPGRRKAALRAPALPAGPSASARLAAKRRSRARFRLPAKFTALLKSAAALPLGPTLKFSPRLEITARLKLSPRFEFAPRLEIPTRLKFSARLELALRLEITARLKLSPLLELSPRFEFAPRLEIPPWFELAPRPEFTTRLEGSALRAAKAILASLLPRAAAESIPGPFCALLGTPLCPKIPSALFSATVPSRPPAKCRPVLPLSAILASAKI